MHNEIENYKFYRLNTTYYGYYIINKEIYK